MKFKIKTLTPIWTGNVNRECTKLRETSILGSLRWWFEAIVRGFGGYACDSVGEVVEKCKFDVDKCEKGANPEELICPVCYVFGTTGWSRRFKLEIDGKLNQISSIIVKASDRKSHRGWFLGTKECGGLLGASKIKIYGDSQLKNVLGLLFELSCSWGIGAKTQDGFGICKFEGQYNVDKAIEKIKELISKYEQTQDNKLLPNLKDFFFVKISIENSERNIREALKNKLFKNNLKESQISVEEFLRHIPKEYKNKFYPTAPLIRYWLRSLFRNGNDDLRYFLFGFVSVKGTPTPICRTHLTHVNKKGEGHFCSKCNRILRDEEIYKKMGSKIFVSHTYKMDNNKWEFKIWSYVPKILPNNESRECILNKLYEEIKENKNFTTVLNLDKNSTAVEWYEVSKERSGISSTEELISNILR